MCGLEFFHRAGCSRYAHLFDDDLARDNIGVELCRMD